MVEFDRGEESGSNEVRYAMGGWVGGWRRGGTYDAAECKLEMVLVV